EESKPSKEKVNIYNKLSESFPDQKFIIYASKQKLNIKGHFSSDKSEFELATQYFKNRSNVKVVPANGIHTSPWIRDWAPFISLRNNNISTLGGYQEDEVQLAQKEISKDITCSGNSLTKVTPESANKLLAQIEHVLNFQGDIEGGDFMVDSKGNCFVAAEDFSHPHCTTVTQLPELPGESTGHLDIYAKLLDDNTVAISKYTSNKTSLLKERKKKEFICNEKQIKNAHWYACARTFQTDSPKSDSIIRENEKVKAFSQQDISRQMDLKNPSFFNWKEHSKKVAMQFKEKGLNVIEIEAPLPVAFIIENTYKNELGEIVHTENGVYHHFPTYTNSLIINDAIAIPEYKHLADQTSNHKAHQTFAKYFGKVVPFGSDLNIMLGGSVHCLTMNVH
ncbi:MAG: agmatine deiminase family protein, partial [Bacteriovoracaceae bacterium]|nr:agmatine deiminase family protein [Bacteriovoracaceae bacterium]